MTSAERRAVLGEAAKRLEALGEAALTATATKQCRVLLGKFVCMAASSIRCLAATPVCNDCGGTGKVQCDCGEFGGNPHDVPCPACGAAPPPSPAPEALKPPTTPAEVLESCAKHQQWCHLCERWTCCDNTNPAKPAPRAPCGECGGAGRLITRFGPSIGVEFEPCPRCSPSSGGKDQG